MIKKATCLVALLGAVGSASTADAAPETKASFEGRTIDLTVDWAGATACLESGGQVTCYRSERQMLGAYATEAALNQSTADGAAAAAAVAACSTSLRLYDGSSFTGQVLMLTSRQTILNLATYGFDNKASSYKVGACSASLYSSSNLGGSVLSAGANSAASSMPSGWGNTVSSVWIG